MSDPLSPKILAAIEAAGETPAPPLIVAKFGYRATDPDAIYLSFRRAKASDPAELVFSVVWKAGEEPVHFDLSPLSALAEEAGWWTMHPQDSL